MNIFFFGYLPLKWRRLSRVISIIITILGLIFLTPQRGSIGDILTGFFFIFLIFIILICIISWVLKPFIIKEK